MGPSSSAATLLVARSARASSLASSSSSSSAAYALTYQQQRRTFLFGLFGKKKDKPNPFAQPPPKKPLLAQDDLFHPLSKSPFPPMRERAERIKRLAPCPVHLARGQRVLVQYECPQSGWPTHYSEKEWNEDPEKGKYIHRLREANEDEHDLRSGREMTEFKLPGPQGFEEAINMSSWDVYFYTRGHQSIESERSRRHASKLMSFPMTVGGVLHENSPYTTRNRRMTREGLRSFLALRQLLHPIRGAKPNLEVIRIFVVGARAESTLPTSVWDQLRYIFPKVAFHVYLIGPEVRMPKIDLPDEAGEAAAGHIFRRQKTRPSNYGSDVPSSTLVISEGLTISYIQSNYEHIHPQLEPFDPYTDVFFAFSPGFGFPSQRAYDTPKDEDGEEIKLTSTATPAGHGVGNIDLVAADIESKGEAGEISKDGSVLPSASERLSSGPPPPSGTADVETASTPAAGTSYSTLPTLPPLLQAQSEWREALTQILSTKCPLVITGFSPADVRRDVEAFESLEGIKGEFEWLITPGENVFGSLSWSVADFDPRVAVKSNWGIWSVRGKRYDLEGPKNPFEVTGGSLGLGGRRGGAGEEE